jgi:hypothetical protein
MLWLVIIVFIFLNLSEELILEEKQKYAGDWKAYEYSTVVG